jgi:molybdopterin molybdotransferase
MISISEAQSRVYASVHPLPAASMRLTPECLGLILGESVAADLDMPPFTKSLMDGYAARTADLNGGTRILEVIEEITAGKTPQRELGQGQAARIMTGAPIPRGADCVVAVEQTQSTGPGRVEIKQQAVSAGQHILERGREMQAGETILEKGHRLRPQEIGLLAAVGRTEVQLFPQPRVAILPTGDEIVEASRKPGPGQIRNSNGPMLASQVARAGAIPEPLGIALDTLESLRTLIATGLKADVLLLSGGVSAGKLDLVPGVLQELGVEAHFHKIHMKPGKPLFFGTRGRTLVFGLPGNPVSSLICFELFVRPALARLMGDADAEPRTVMARLKRAMQHKSDRPTYHPAFLVFEEAGPVVDPSPWFGSADLRGLASSNAFVVFPPADEVFEAGRLCPVLVVDDSPFSRHSRMR